MQYISAVGIQDWFCFIVWFLQPKYYIIVLVHESRTGTMELQNDKQKVKSFDCVQQKNGLSSLNVR